VWLLHDKEARKREQTEEINNEETEDNVTQNGVMWLIE
jgi:hypothetical protein